MIDAGFELERVIEESDSYTENAPYIDKYYSEHKAGYINHSIIIKARKNSIRQIFFCKVLECCAEIGVGICFGIALGGLTFVMFRAYSSEYK